jgi:hypothetical protein
MSMRLIKGLGDRLLGVGARRVSLAVSMLLLAVVPVGVGGSVALAVGCPNEQVRVLQVNGLELPDCRAYEQVSPVDKNGVDAVGGVGAVQASPAGGSVVYASEAPFPQATGSQGGTPFYLGVRSVSPEGWSTFGLTPPTEPGPGFEIHGGSSISGSTEDLARTIVVEEEQALAPGATPGKPNAYVRDNATGVYQLLAGNLLGLVFFADATPGGARIIFETNSELSVSGGPQPAPGVTNLYEWDEAMPLGERVSVVGVLPSAEGGEAPVGGSYAGGAGATNHSLTQNTISQDGSRVFFTDAGTGRIYMRLPQADTAVTIPVSQGAAGWQASTPSGSFVFYTEGSELYRFNVDGFEKSVKPEPEALVEAREQITNGAEGVQGTLGVSSDGAYAYFVAPGKLASNKREYRNAQGETVEEEAVMGASNLYVWHEGEASPVFIEQQGTEDGRVASDGKTILFASVAPLTGYPNASNCQGSGRPCAEFFRYTVATGVLSCVSCSSAETSVTMEPFFTRQDAALTAIPGQRGTFVTRNLSEDGTRVFFETEEALVSQDGNSQMDVYEWEAEGAGSCSSASASFGVASGGCLYLISTGQSAQPSYFGDASADGSSVFFFTRQSLVSMDQDGNQDVYDAREGGGILAQNPLPSLSCAGDACRGTAAQAPPVFGVPSSVSLSVNGNLSPSPPSMSAARKRCVKPKKSSHGKCVKTRSRKKPAKRRSRSKHSAKKTGETRRGSR